MCKQQSRSEANSFQLMRLVTTNGGGCACIDFIYKSTTDVSEHSRTVAVGAAYCRRETEPIA